jgi:catechol 2,3-dioxygenase-like lactoylglutathione lyase family enzyme
MDYKLELIVLPVSDVDRAKDFYVEECGFNLDVDHRAGDQFRVVQMTPPGSSCSVTIGVGISEGTPGSYKGMHLVVTDIAAARDELVGRGVAVGNFHYFDQTGRHDGLHPDRADYGTFASFDDPDGNTWLLQERKGSPARA